MTYKVLIPQDIVEERKQWLRERGCEIKMGSGTSLEALCRDAADCDAILARTALYPTEVLRAAPKLKVISRFGVGTDNIDVATAEQMGIWVTIAGTANYKTVAEQALACIVSLGRRMTYCENKFRDGDFEIRNKAKPCDLEGKTLGILGFGKIGRALAEKARLGLGMRLLTYDPYLPAEKVPAGIERTDSWEEAFSRPDFVSLHMPSTGKPIVGAKEFSLMKPTAYFINLARGDLVDEAALVEALRSKCIAGAGLDVFAQEPPPKDHPLFGLDDVILTPHNAGLTTEAMRRVALQAAQGIWEVLSGEEPTWPVNHPTQPRRALDKPRVEPAKPSEKAPPYSAFPNKFRQRILARERMIGCWSALGNQITAEVLGLAGFDWLLLDSEHAPNDVLSMIPQLMALKDSPSAPVVRPAWNDTVLLKRLARCRIL